MEADKSQNLQDELTCWRPRRTRGVVTVLNLAGLKARKGGCFSLSLKAGKIQCPCAEAVRLEEAFILWGGLAFCSMQTLKSLDEAHPLMKDSLLYSVY